MTYIRLIHPLPEKTHSPGKHYHTQQEQPYKLGPEDSEPHAL